MARRRATRTTRPFHSHPAPRTIQWCRSAPLSLTSFAVGLVAQARSQLVLASHDDQLESEVRCGVLWRWWQRKVERVKRGRGTEARVQMEATQMPPRTSCTLNAITQTCPAPPNHHTHEDKGPVLRSTWRSLAPPSCGTTIVYLQHRPVDAITLVQRGIKNTTSHPSPITPSIRCPLIRLPRLLQPTLHEADARHH